MPIFPTYTTVTGTIEPWEHIPLRHVDRSIGHGNGNGNGNGSGPGGRQRWAVTGALPSGIAQPAPSAL
jgi:hypothetical protein